MLIDVFFASVVFTKQNSIHGIRYRRIVLFSKYFLVFSRWIIDWFFPNIKTADSPKLRMVAMVEKYMDVLGIKSRIKTKGNTVKAIIPDTRALSIVCVNSQKNLKKIGMLIPVIIAITDAIINCRDWLGV